MKQPIILRDLFTSKCGGKPDISRSAISNLNLTLVGNGSRVHMYSTVEMAYSLSKVEKNTTKNLARTFLISSYTLLLAKKKNLSD